LHACMHVRNVHVRTWTPHCMVAERDVDLHLGQQRLRQLCCRHLRMRNAVIVPHCSARVRPFISDFAVMWPAIFACMATHAWHHSLSNAFRCAHQRPLLGKGLAKSSHGWLRLATGIPTEVGLPLARERLVPCGHAEINQHLKTCEALDTLIMQPPHAQCNRFCRLAIASRQSLAVLSFTNATQSLTFSLSRAHAQTRAYTHVQHDVGDLHVCVCQLRSIVPGRSWVRQLPSAASVRSARLEA
jgi:hypothetical protein